MLDATQTNGQNSINWSVTPGLTAGTAANGDPSTIASYRLTCSATSGNSAYPTVVKTYPKATADTCSGAAGSTATTGCNLPGLSITAYSCSIVAINAEGIESPALTGPVTVV